MRYLIIIIFILFSFNSFSSGDHKHDHDHKEKKVMKKNPVSVGEDTLAASALSIMNSKKITSLCVHSDKNKNKTIGVLHIHNILSSNIS